MRRSLFTLAAIAASAAFAAAADSQSDVGATAAAGSISHPGPVAVTPARVASITDHHDAAITKLSESIIASRDDDDYVDSALDSLIEHGRMFEDVEMIAHQVHEQLLEGAYPRVARMLKSGEVDEEALKMVVSGRTALHQVGDGLSLRLVNVVRGPLIALAEAGVSRWGPASGTRLLGRPVVMSTSRRSDSPEDRPNVLADAVHANSSVCLVTL